MTSDNYIFDLDNVEKSTSQPKSIYAGDVYTDQPYVTVTDEGIFIAADKTKALAITEKYGIHMTGQISLSANPNQILLGGGYWCLNPLLLSCLPSTSATPIPTLVKCTPPLLSGSDSLNACLSFLESNGL